MNKVRPNNLLSKLTRADEGELFDNLKEYSAGRSEILQRAGEVIDYVYFPTCGMVSLLAVMRDGQSVEAAAVGYDNAVGYNNALSGRNSNCQVIVQLPLQSLRITRSAFALAYENSVGVQRMIHYGNELFIQQLQQNTAGHALHAAEGRLARCLLQAHDKSAPAIPALTKEFVAEMLGVLRPTVSILANTL